MHQSPPLLQCLSVYKEVRRTKKQIAADHVSLEAKEKLLKNKKGFYTTVIVLLVILLSYVPTYICVVILISLTRKELLPIAKSLLTATYPFCFIASSE